jgi:hypothetical protein
MARIAAKLAASEREADAARVKAKLRAARLSRGKGVSSIAANGNSPAAQQGSTSSAAAISAVRGSEAAGDPVKLDRGVSGSSVSAAGMTGSGASYSTDENGQMGGVSVREEHHVVSTVAAADDGGGVSTGAVDYDGSSGGGGHGDKQTAMPSPRKATSSPRKAASPTKGSASPAKERPRRREVRSRADRVANRRRSTLSPWELQSLISGEVVPPSPRRPVQAAEHESALPA